MIGLYQLIFFIFVTCVVGILIGFKFAIHIYNPVLYALFWIMYIITALCLGAILFNLYSYDTIRYKTGPKGKQGDRGEDGEKGETGVCDSNCRDDILYYELMTYCEKILNEWENSESKPIQISNKYWKDRISMIVKSKEVTNLMNVKGRDDVIEYIKKILKVWLDMLYKEGGRSYFESIGAENEFEWRKVNPWNEIKKYDLYYWGMRNDMRIKTFSKCRPKIERDMTPKLKIMTTDHYDLVWNDKHNLGRSESNKSIWKPKILHQNNTPMYPVGDIMAPRSGDYSHNGTHHRGHISFTGNYNTGPVQTTILVSGDVTKPAIDAYDLGSSYYKYCADWLCSMSGYRIGKKRKSNVNYWRLKCPAGYESLGDVATKGAKPDFKNYRCIHKDCLEPLNKSKYPFFTPEGSRQGWKVEGDENEHYNLFHVTDKGKSDDKQFWKIKPDCLSVKEVPPETDPVYNKGWYPNPKPKDKKYSVMNYMALPTNARLINVGNPKINISINLVPNVKEFNLYYIRHYSQNEGSDAEITLEAISPDNLKWRSIIKDYDKDSLRWIVNMDEAKQGQMTIKSEAHNKYLRYVDNGDINLVNHNSADNYAYWKLHA